LRLPTVGANCLGWADQAIKENRSHLSYLEALLGNEVAEQERHTVERRLREAHLPRLKTLEEFEFGKTPSIEAPLLHRLAEGEYIRNAEPVLFLGDCGTGKTHLLTALCVAACRQKRRVRFTTAAGLVNDLQEAHHQNQLSRALAKWARYEVLAIDELGYVPFAEASTELLFQVLSERAERKAILVTTNLPFSEWTTVFPNPRLCKALLDRLTDRAHIIETGRDSYRFRRTVEMRKGKGNAKSA
jgi:DNA replication protein DnaC